MKKLPLTEKICIKCQNIFWSSKKKRHCDNCWHPWNRGLNKENDKRIANAKWSSWAKGITRPNQQALRENRKCRVCGLVFRTKVSSRKVTCSMKCSYVERGRRRAAIVEERKCLLCGRNMIIKLRKTINMFCSIRCSNASPLRNEKISLSQKGIPETDKTKEINSKTQKRKWSDPEYRKIMLPKTIYNPLRIEKSRKASSKKLKQRWAANYDGMVRMIRESRPLAIIGYKNWWNSLNIEEKKKFTNNIISKSNRRPNKSETEILQLILDKNFVYAGGGGFAIEGKKPDFVNKEKRLIIEFNGCYWHDCAECNREDYIENVFKDDERILHFAKYGYETLIIWGHELQDLEKLEGKLLSFAF